MADAMLESNWPQFPVTLQKYIIILIADMQKPIQYRGFIIANLGLRTFLGVRPRKYNSLHAKSADSNRWNILYVS